VWKNGHHLCSGQIWTSQTILAVDKYIGQFGNIWPQGKKECPVMGMIGQTGLINKKLAQ